MSLVCKAIRERHLLEFHYRGKLRIVAPYCHGVSTRGTEVLRGIQVGGTSGSRMGIGKLWAIADMVEPRILDVPFIPNDPNYNPDDSAMREIHCRI